MDSHSHIFLASHLHTAAANGGGDVLVGIAVVFASTLFLFAVAWFLRGGDGSDPGPEGGGGGPGGPSSPPDGPSWWPDFERDFARYVARRRYTHDPVGAAPRERAFAPTET